MSEVQPVEHWRCGTISLEHGLKDWFLTFQTFPTTVVLTDDLLRDLKALLEKVEL
jgi:hypothetical protein